MPAHVSCHAMPSCLTPCVSDTRLCVDERATPRLTQRRMGDDTSTCHVHTAHMMHHICLVTSEHARTSACTYTNRSLTSSLMTSPPASLVSPASPWRYVSCRHLQHHNMHTTAWSLMEQHVQAQLTHRHRHRRMSAAWRQHEGMTYHGTPKQRRSYTTTTRHHVTPHHITSHDVA